MLVAAGAVWLLLAVGMNRTHAQSMLTAHTWAQVELHYSVRNAVFGAAVWFGSSGLAALLLAAQQGRLGRVRDFPRRVLWSLAAGLAVVALAPFFSPVYLEHDGFVGLASRLYPCAAAAAGLAGWLLTPCVIRPGFALAGLGALGLVALRTNVWDYYFIDLALLGWGGVRLAAAEPDANPGPAITVAPRWGWVLALLVAGYHLNFAWELKLRLDRDYAVCVLTEEALRDGALASTDIGHAPYGFIGWQLHRYYLAHDGRHDPDTGAFTRYLRRGATSVQFSPMRFWADSQTLQKPPSAEPSRVVRSAVVRVGWLWHQRCTLLREPAAQIQPAEITRAPAAIIRRPLPLTDAEWRAATNPP